MPNKASNNKIVLTKAQQCIFDNITTNVSEYPGRYHASINGYAGTGKSTLISRIIAWLRAQNYSVAVTTPTHKANKVISRMLFNEKIKASDDLLLCTIHSFLGLKLVYEENHQKLVLSKTKNSQYNPDVLIVDECSMVSDELLKHIMDQASRVRRCIIFLGDECQLPPVDTNKTTMELSKTFEFGNQYKLTEVLRQAADNPIIGFSIKVRECLKTKTHPVSLLKQTEFTDAIYKINSASEFTDTYIDMIRNDDMEKLFDSVENNKILSYTNAKVDDYNKYIRDRLFADKASVEFFEGEPIVYEEVTENCPFFVQDSMLCPRIVPDMYLGIECWRLHYPSGDVVYAVGPSSKAGYNEFLKMMVDAIKLKMENPLTKRPFCWQDYYVIKNRICVINYPYATTIHKSQGSTFDNIWLDLGYLAKVPDIESAVRILYTGITRPRQSILLLND